MTLELRAQAEELMDADDLDPATYADVVGDLAQVNAVTLAARPTLAFLSRAFPPLPPGEGQAAQRRRVRATGSGTQDVARPHPSGPTGLLPSPGGRGMKILDVGFGDGDMLRRIAHWAARRKIDAELVGVDLNPRSELAARAHTSSDFGPGLPIRWLTGDYAGLAGAGWDCVISSLVAHHMTRAQLVAFLRFMERESARGWLVNDLHRHGFAYRGFPLLARLARWHPIVRHDGQLSIARSYRPAEWAPLLAEAGIRDARVYRAFPFRLCVERLR